MHTSIDRRSFLKSGAIATGVAASAGLGISATALADESSAADTTGDSLILDQESYQTARWSFEIPPEPIPEEDITETYEAEVIVIGAGMSGLCTALSAIESGLSVTLFSMSAAPVARGGSNFAVYSKLMEEQGIPRIDGNVFLRTQLCEASYDVDTKKWYKWFNNSEESMNWMINLQNEYGNTVVLEQGSKGIPENDPIYAPVSSHNWINDEYTVPSDGQPCVVEAIADKIQQLGGTIHYSVTAKQLIREDDNTGRVTGVIAQKDDGSYVRYNGSKAIVMATGDFSADRDLMARYCPQAYNYITNWDGDSNPDVGKVYNGLYKGDGQKMGLWVGAAWQRSYPNAAMMGAGFGGPCPSPMNAPFSMLLDINGHRFCSEQLSVSFMGRLMEHCKDHTVATILDSDYPTLMQPWAKSKTALGSEEATQSPEDVLAQWDAAVESGTMVKGDTLEEVIEQLGLPMEETLASIERYNSFAESGVDEDFYKSAEFLQPIVTPPFYGWKMNYWFLHTVLGGLRTNENAQVCDANDEPIPGLYNVGTMMGDMHGVCYTYLMEGFNYGSTCLTYGYLTGKYIAENE